MKFFFLAVIMSLCVGLGLPVNYIVYKDVINIIVIKPSTTYVEALKPLIIKFAIITGCIFVTSFLQAGSVYLVGIRLKRRFKYKFFAALLNQKVTWFDTQQTGELITHITDDIEAVVDGCIFKLVEAMQLISSFIASIAVALYFQWMLTLIGLIILPVMVLIFTFLIRFIKKFAVSQVKAYSLAGGIAEEILNGLKTVTSYNAQETETYRYTINLSKAESYGVKKAICQGLAGGSIFMIAWLSGSLIFYTGLRFYEKNHFENPGEIVLVFFNVIFGCVSLGSAIPMIESFLQAQAAGYTLFQIINQVNRFEGDIVFKNVCFAYPMRPGIKILKNFSFTIPQGKKVAFIGPSGSGKSTIIQLLLRFYNPNSGKILLSNTNIRTLNLKWYRSKIGVVHQEPPLFSESISKNIQFGKLNATDEEIITAAKKSNAYEFIMRTADKFQTKLENRGGGFSGGQKQRIAIATALIGERSLLLLDEATSALDTVSQKQVQETLDKNLLDTGNRVTVVIVAHRLSTVRNADIIVVLKPEGKIVEKGNHDELMKKKGMYYEMLQKQNKKPLSSPKNCEENIDELKEDESSTDISDFQRSKSTFIVLPKESPCQFFYDILQIMRINKSHQLYVLFGILGSMLIGSIFPIGSLIYAQMFEVFTYKYTDINRYRKEGNFFCILMTIPAAISLIGSLLKYYGFGKSGEALTTKLRNLMLTSILKQEMAWFDESDHQPGVLVGRLATEASQAKAVAGIQIGVLLEAITCMTIALCISCSFNWQLTITCLMLFPLTIIGGIMQAKSMGGSQSNTEGGVDITISFVLECLNNVRVIQALNLQDYFSRCLKVKLAFNKRRFHKKLLFLSFFCAIGSSGIFLTYTVIYWVGAIMLDDPHGTLKPIDLMRVFACMSMSSSAIGRALGNFTDVGKARTAVRMTLNTINRQSKINPLSSSGDILPGLSFGQIEFHHVTFHYPARPNLSVLKNLNATIKPEQSVALVGPSGCGKSTILQLLERYYDPLPGMGVVTLDGHDIRSLNLRWLRSRIGLVQQEPRLFNMSVTDNICLGLKKDEIDVNRLRKAALDANIHHFIMSLPDGYDTQVGQCGGLLSGGQKQRICIARALYREPALLLLDEATSALDNESEAVVQKALNAASRGHTSVTVAHRLTTVQNCDTILVLDKGSVAASGSHQQLMSQIDGIYYELYTDGAN